LPLLERADAADRLTPPVQELRGVRGERQQLLEQNEHLQERAAELQEHMADMQVWHAGQQPQQEQGRDLCRT